MIHYLIISKEGVIRQRGHVTDEKHLPRDLGDFGVVEVIDENDPRMPNSAPEPTYQDFRRLEYPPVEEFADAYYWATQGDTSKMDVYLAKITSVKQANPK